MRKADAVSHACETQKAPISLFFAKLPPIRSFPPFSPLRPLRLLSSLPFSPAGELTWSLNRTLSAETKIDAERHLASPSSLIWRVVLV